MGAVFKYKGWSLVKQRTLYLFCLKGRIGTVCEATSMADGVSQQEESKYLKIEQAAFRDSELKGFKNQTGNRMSLTFIQTPRICAFVKFKPCGLSCTYAINEKEDGDQQLTAFSLSTSTLIS